MVVQLASSTKRWSSFRDVTICMILAIGHDDGSCLYPRTRKFSTTPEVENLNFADLCVTSIAANAMKKMKGSRSSETDRWMHR